MGEEITSFVDCLAAKLPKADYESSDTEADMKDAINALQILHNPAHGQADVVLGLRKSKHNY
jgi:hypothetical protein